MQNEKDVIVIIPIDRYESLFENWIKENNIYIDMHIYNKKMKQFDESLGLQFSDKLYMDTDSTDYIFTIIDGIKFSIAQLKYSF